MAPLDNSGKAFNDSFLELIITGGILAIAGEITTNRTYTPKILSHGKKSSA